MSPCINLPDTRSGSATKIISKRGAGTALANTSGTPTTDSSTNQIGDPQGRTARNRNLVKQSPASSGVE